MYKYNSLLKLLVNMHKKGATPQFEWPLYYYSFPLGRFVCLSSIPVLNSTSSELVLPFLALLFLCAFAFPFLVLPITTSPFFIFIGSMLECLCTYTFNKQVLFEVLFLVHKHRQLQVIKARYRQPQ
jgi:hypothetical protein